MSEIENLKIYGGATYTVGNQDIIANEWEAGVTYVKGKSYVIREHKLYVCNVTHTSVEPFDVTKWTEITVGEAIAANTTAIGDLSTLTTTDKSSIVGAVNEVNSVTDISSNVSKTSIVNDFEKSVIKNNKLVSFYVGFSVNTAPSGVGGIATGFPIPKTLKQIPLICVSGTNKGKVARCAIDLNGNLINYYSDTSIWHIGDVYIVNACYLTA